MWLHHYKGLKHNSSHSFFVWPIGTWHFNIHLWAWGANPYEFFCQTLKMDPYPIHLFDYSTKQKGVKRFKNIPTNVGRCLFCKITFILSSNFFFLIWKNLWFWSRIFTLDRPLIYFWFRIYFLNLEQRVLKCGKMWRLRSWMVSIRYIGVSKLNSS